MSEETLVHIFWERVAANPERPAILYKTGGIYRPVIWREHGRVVELVSGGLLHQAVQAGEKIAIIANSRPHWTWADLAILSVGAVTVPIYPTLAAPEIEYLLRHSDVIGIFAENERQLNKLLCLKELPPQLRFVVLMEGKIPLYQLPGIHVLTWEDLLKDAEVYLPSHPNILPERIAAISSQDLATIVYTSGTTGIPKGAMLLQGNLYAVCRSLSHLVGFYADDVSLSFLPLSHVYERVSGQFLAIYEGFVMAYAESLETVAQNMLEVKPTILNGVPRFYEKIYQRMLVEIRHLAKPQQYLIRWALALGRRAMRYREMARNGVDDIVRKIYKAELRVAERLVFSRIRRRFGGRLRFLVSGAAPLSSEVQLFFETIGLSIIQGYGLTETAAPVCCNTPMGNRRGTVGRPLPGVEVQLAPDGEIMVRGPTVFAGYYKNDEATREAFQDGWFLTGDIGEVDADGYLRVKDRKKDIIITSGGKHVAPQFLENLFVGEGLISHVLVYGDKRKYITALITLHPDCLAAFAKANAITYTSLEELTHHDRVKEAVEEVVSRKNQRLASFEQIKKFLILDRDFSVDSNELTPTLKIKRKVVTEKYKDLLDSLYEVEELELKEPR
ncbi:MAG: long-chain fatty acid--CoA ligase [Candidatus Melainabacteria bacterium]|nr:long-chain fatty acid--CoA ligase [Candidatus Melainabacteria bacterium]